MPFNPPPMPPLLLQLPAAVSQMPDELFNAAALLQSLTTIAFGAGLAFYATRFWKRWDARKKEEDEAGSQLKVRNAEADAERLTLRADSGLNKEHHARFQAADEEIRETVRQLEAKLRAVEVAALKNDARNEARNEATKEALARIDGQLSSLIKTFLHRA